jgi:hypothetical protein
MAKYFQTAQGYLSTDDDNVVPDPSWTEISKAQYDALVQSQVDAENQANAAALAAANQRWTQTRDDLVASGVPAPTAELLANTVGVRPA